VISHDYECSRCNSIFEAMVEAERGVLPCPVCKDGKAKRVYLKFGGMLGKNKGLFPYFDQQLGVSVESSQHREQIAKQRGLITMGKDEFNRSRNAPRTPDPLDSDKVDPELIEMAKRIWDDIKFGRLPPEVEEKRVADVAADYLDADSVKVE